MSKSTPNPFERSWSSTEVGGSIGAAALTPKPTSLTTYHIAGILTDVFGLEELPEDCTDVTCLWLLNPRLQTKESMAPLAAHTIAEWNKARRPNAQSKNAESTSSSSKRGLIAVAFDQRNHGTREVRRVSNGAWREGNENHAQDMFGCYHGTAVDTSMLLDYIEGYIFPPPPPPPSRGDDAGGGRGSGGDDKQGPRRRITQNIVIGVSLGGHAAWHCVMHDPRITAAVIIIGCPDYTRLMSDRARLSKRASYTSSSPPGVDFIGSVDFPPSLVAVVARNDPAAFFWSQFRGDADTAKVRQDQAHLIDSPSDSSRAALVPALARTLGNKRILNLSGGADKLVPYHCGKPFLDWLKRAIGPGGVFEHGGLHLEDIIVDGAGHEVPPAMVQEMVRFVVETMQVPSAQDQLGLVGTRGRDSRM